MLFEIPFCVIFIFLSLLSMAEMKEKLLYTFFAIERCFNFLIILGHKYTSYIMLFVFSSTKEKTAPM